MTLNLLEETIDHFNHGAKSVRAYSSEHAIIITLSSDEAAPYFITHEEAPQSKKKEADLEPYFREVFGIEARY